MEFSKEAEAAKAAGYTVFFLKEDGGAEFLMRRPTKAELMFFQDTVLKNGGIAAAQEKFVRSLLVGAQAAELDAFLNAQPLAAGKMFDEIAGDMGLNANFTKTQA